MRPSILAFATVTCLPAAVALAGGPTDARAKGATVVGTVCARLGTYVVVALTEGAKLQPNEEFLVGRPALLVAVAKGKERVEAWDNWRQAGRIKVRFPWGARHWVAFVTEENSRTGPGGEPAPNIRPGDIVYRPPGGRPTSPKPKAP